VLRLIRNLLLIALAAVAVLAVISAIRIQTFRIDKLAREAPERTAMMRQREREAARDGKKLTIRQRWVPYSRISPLLRRAILVAEDDAFYLHGGLDWNEIQASARKNLEKRQIVRGGSTITQQLAKNIYLGDARTITRKLEEAFLAMRMERTLGKRRIFELYLNLIEWGDGVFGAEAASRRYFGVPASALNERQAVLLAAVVINPRRFSPTAPSKRIERRARMIASRLRRRGFFTEDQYLVAIGQPPKPSFFDWLFGPSPQKAVPVEPGPDTTEAPPEPPAPEAPPDSAVLDTIPH
jgi:monofunctional biosynthetic peptidoglycan transglycosylase